MQRWILMLLLTAGVAFGLAACSEESPTNADPTAVPEFGEHFFRYSGRFVLYVPFLMQVPPGDWSGTHNCGQAVGVMLGSYFNNGHLAPWVIDEENKWLGCRAPNGCETSASRLCDLLWGFHRLHTRSYVGSTADDVLNEVVNNGKPTIVGVRISGGELTSRGGRSHWALAVGYDGRSGKIILNDPGTKRGFNIEYPVRDFEASWKADGRRYIPVWK